MELTNLPVVFFSSLPEYEVAAELDLFNVYYGDAVYTLVRPDDLITELGLYENDRTEIGKRVRTLIYVLEHVPNDTYIALAR